MAHSSFSLLLQLGSLLLQLGSQKKSLLQKCNSVFDQKVLAILVLNAVPKQNKNFAAFEVCHPHSSLDAHMETQHTQKFSN